MGSLPAAPIPSRRLPRIGQAGHPPSGPNVPALGYGLAFGVSCREDYPFATPDELAAAGREAFPNYPASVTTGGCRRLGVFQRGLP